MAHTLTAADVTLACRADIYGDLNVTLYTTEAVARAMLARCLDADGCCVSPLPHLLWSHDAGDGWAYFECRLPGVYGVCVGCLGNGAWGLSLSLPPTCRGADELDALDYTSERAELDLDGLLSASAVVRPLLALAA